MSWESSALYYELINEGVKARLGGLHSAVCVMASVDFAEIEVLQSEGRWDDAGRLLGDEAAALERAGAELLVLCTNTMHKVAPQIQSRIGIRLLHIADATADAIETAGVGTVGLLGTRFTMDEPFYRERLESRGLTVVLPEPGDRAIVNRIIYDELVLGQVREESREQYRRVIRDLIARGAEGVILGCTEIELLVGQTDSAVPVFPTTAIHAQAAVDAALS